MTYITDKLDHIGSIESTPKWTGRIASWIQARKRKRASKQAILHLLSFDDHKLEDVGMTRTELIGELGYDPDRSRELLRIEYLYRPRL